MNNLWNKVYTNKGEEYFHNPWTNKTSWSLPSNGILVNQHLNSYTLPVANIVYIAEPFPSRELREERLKEARKKR